MSPPIQYSAPGTRDSGAGNPHPLSHVHFVLACLASAAAIAFLYTWNLEVSPPHFHQDEAGFGLAAYLLATTGRDYFGNLLPVYVGYFDHHQLGGAMLPYWAVPFVVALGPSVGVLRLSMAVAGMGTLSLFAILAWRLTGNRWLALVGAWLLGTTPMFFIQSRVFLEMLLPIPFVVAWLLCLVEYDRTRRERFILLAAAVLGVGFYSYGTARVVDVVYLLLTLAACRLVARCSWRAVARSIGIFTATMLPAMAFALSNTELYLERFHSLTWLTPGTPPITAASLFLDHYISSFDLSDLFVRGDASLVHSTGLSGVFLKTTLPLFLLGLASLARCAITGAPLGRPSVRRSGLQPATDVGGVAAPRTARHSSLLVPHASPSPTLPLLIAAFLLFPVPVALLSEYHAPARATYVLPIYALICVAGLKMLASRSRKSAVGGLLVAAIAVALAIESGAFFADYFGGYAQRVAVAGTFGGNKPAAFRALFADRTAGAVFVDTEDGTTLTYARFFKAETGFEGAVMPAPPEWAGRLPDGSRLLTARPAEYGVGFKALATIPEANPDRPPYTVLEKGATP